MKDVIPRNCQYSVESINLFKRPLYQTGECHFGERKTGAKQSGQMNVLKSISKEICHDPCRTLPLFIPREVDVIVFFSIGSCVLHFTTADVSSWTHRCNNNIQPSPMPVQCLFSNIHCLVKGHKCKQQKQKVSLAFWRNASSCVSVKNGNG